MTVDFSYEEKSNLLQNLDSCTHIEDFSNEIFYEIFEYIECCNLFDAFANLNNRFDNLLDHPFLSLKINLAFPLGTTIYNYYQQCVIPNKHRIISLCLDDRSDVIDNQSLLSIIDSSFNRLQSLVLNQVRHREFISFCPILTSLPRLLSITIHFNDSIMDRTEIYRQLFLLFTLKKLEISAKGYLLIMPLSINTSEQYSYIKHLIINHACNLQELVILLSYTPQLSHLICIELIKQDQQIQGKISIKMLHLTNITFNMCNTQFSELEIFIEQICKQLRVLYINTSEDIAYLDATRWERVISQYMPYLYTFKFEYQEWYYQNIELTSHHHLLNQFTSVFWINRGWSFQITADIDYWPPIKIIYSIRPNKKKCDQTVNIKLIIDRLYFATSRQNLTDIFFSFISEFHITHLDVDCKKLLSSKLIKLLFILPNLQSLGTLSLSSFKLKCLSQEDTESVQLWSRNNNITKMVFDRLIEENDLEKMQFFIDLAPQMKYLKVKCEKNFNIESIVRYILMKNIDKIFDLNLFCLWVPIADDDMVEQLQKMINLEELIDSYTITRTTDRIYLQWKLK